MADNKKPFYFCQVCNVACSSEGNKYGHLTGARHLKNVEQQRKGVPDTGSGRRRESNGAQVSGIPVKQEQVGPLDFKGVRVPIIGLQHIVEQPQKPGSMRQFLCDLCTVKLGVESVIPHASGLKHRMEYLKMYAEEDFNKLSGLPRSEQTVAVSSMAHNCEMKNGRGRIKYLPQHLQAKPQARVEKEEMEYQAFVQRVRATNSQTMNIPPLMQEKNITRNNRPFYDDVSYQPDTNYNDPIHSDDYREGPGRKYARRDGEHPGEIYREDTTFGVISRSNYKEKMGIRSKHRDDKYDDDKYHDDKYHDDKYRDDKYRDDKYRDDKYRDVKYRDIKYRDDKYRDEKYRDDFVPVQQYEDKMPSTSRGDDYRRTEDRYVEYRERDQERPPVFAEPNRPHRSVSPSSQFPVERLLQTEDGNIRLSGGNLGALLSILSKCVVKNEDDAQMALQVSNALTQSLLKYRFQSMPGELLSATLSKSAENFLGNQGGVVGGFGDVLRGQVGNSQMPQGAGSFMMSGTGMMRDQALSRDQLPTPQQQLQQQQLRQQLQILQEQQHELEMKQKMKEELRQEMHHMHHHQLMSDEDKKYQQYSSGGGGSSYMYNQY